MRTGRFPRRVVLVAGLGLCLIPAAAALCWRPIALRYHLWHLSHGPCAYRDGAFRFLLRWNESGCEECRVDEAAILTQGDGRSMLAVFEPDDDEDTELGEREVWLFDQEGRLIYTGTVHPGDFRDLTGDGTNDLVIDCSWTTDDDRDFEVFSILSTNQIMRPLLIVCCDEVGNEPWSCRPRPSSPGIQDVEIGRGWDENFTPIVTYRWSPEARAYVGPKGGGGEPYVRFDSWEELQTFLSSPGAFQPSENAR